MNMSNVFIHIHIYIYSLTKDESTVPLPSLSPTDLCASRHPAMRLCVIFSHALRAALELRRNRCVTWRPWEALFRPCHLSLLPTNPPDRPPDHPTARLSIQLSPRPTDRPPSRPLDLPTSHPSALSAAPARPHERTNAQPPACASNRPPDHLAARSTA